MNAKLVRIAGLSLLLATAFPAGAEGDGRAPLRLSEPVEVTSGYETFGSPLPETGDVISLAALLAKPEQYLGRQVQVETRVAKVCQKKGCFFIAQDGDAIVRVSFRDYSFFVPTDTGGKSVRLAGTLERQTLDTGDAEHMNDDLGDDEGTVAAGPEFAIVATSVRIPRS